ncbi:hypothetical protein AL051_04030 [Pseudomonas amygdali pv. dendropanacis]|nr:hypothetical protein AL051_04030 [Pseudomonas amygdali pv. dendropanacis]
MTQSPVPANYSRRGNVVSQGGRRGLVFHAAELGNVLRPNVAERRGTLGAVSHRTEGFEGDGMRCYLRHQVPILALKIFL